MVGFYVMPWVWYPLLPSTSARVTTSSPSVQFSCVQRWAAGYSPVNRDAWDGAVQLLTEYAVRKSVDLR